LCQVWPSHFPTLASAEPYAHQPEQLADCIYAGRLGNGPAGSGDGWRFRGEGPIELTGRGLISQFAAAFNMSPDQAAAWMLTPPGGAAAACWYWTLPAHPRSLLALSDTWDVAGVTRIINGGLINLNRREALCTAALRAVS
jgi:putative chitinase